MTLKELHEELNIMKFPEDRYYLQGLYGSSDDNDKIALNIKQGKYAPEYQVYYKERGEKYSERIFETESEACEYVLNQILEQVTIEKVQNITGLDGMTLNERLHATELIDEFNKVKKSNKVRASQILRILRVDKLSIDKIINKKKWWQQ